MARTIFRMGFEGPSGWDTMPSGIPVYRMTREQVDLNRAGVLRRLPVPPGVTVEYPYMVKIEGEGEYWVKSDGTASFYSYKTQGWEPPELVENR